MTDTKIIVALDFATTKEALALSARLSPQLCRVKVGKELFTSAGPALVEQLQNAGFEVFLDLKFHDIPNTVAAACRAASALGVWMINVHALGGRAMLEAAHDAVEHAQARPKLIAVTLLTSMTQQDLHDVGIEGTPESVVSRLAGIAQESGLDGVVCSAQEAARLRKERGAHFCLVTPGMRLANHKVSGDDQQRIMTPEKAMSAGADYLVIGRPITQAADPIAVLETINAGIGR